MHIYFITHADFESPGAINDWITKKGHTSSTIRPYKGEKLIPDDRFDFLIIMGGPQSPTDLTQFPYLKDEILFTQQAIKNNKIILGICLGAQIIGEALGAKTGHSPHKEIGSFPISLTSEGLQDSIFKHFPQQFDVIHWHNDMPGVPKDAKVLAESLGCPRQVIRYSKKIYGLQCHMEMTTELIQGMLNHCKEDLSPGLYIQTSQEMLATNFSAINKKLYFILDKLAE